MKHSEVGPGNYYNVLVPEAKLKSAIPLHLQKAEGITCTGEFKVKTMHYNVPILNWMHSAVSSFWISIRKYLQTQGLGIQQQFQIL